MKKFIFALCFNQLVYADGFADLKQIQDKFYEHIYRAGPELGVVHVTPTSAPEVAYIAGLLRLQPVTLRGSDEANAIYMSLINRGGSRNVGGSRCDYPPNAQASAAFNASDFSALTRYNKYLETGHSVLGVAAQEEVVLRFAAPPPAAVAPAVAPGIGGLLSGFGGFKNAGVKPPEGSAVAAAPAPAAESLLVKVQNKINELTAKNPKTKDENTDLILLQELEQKLGVSPAAGTSAEDAARLENLKALFDSMSIADSTARGMAMGQLRMGLTKKAAAAEKDPVEAAIALCVSGNTAGVPSAISDNQAAVKTAIDRLKALGDSATKPQKDILRILERRFNIMSVESDDEGSDDDEFGPVRENLSITSTPSPVPAQAAVTNAPVTVPTPVGASTLVNATNASKKSPQSARGFVPGAFKGFSPLPATGAGGGVVKKAVAAPKVAGLSSEEKAERRAALQTEIAELKAKIENGSANMKEKLRLTAANTELSNLG